MPVAETSTPVVPSASAVDPEPDVWEEEEEDSEDDGDEDIDAEAQEIARRLGEQLWADITRVQAAAAAAPAPAQTLPPLEKPPDASSQGSKVSKQEAVIMTMKTVLDFASKDPLVQSALASTTLPGLSGDSILSVIQRNVAVNNVPRDVAMPLSQALITLAKSEALFGSLRHSNASAAQLDRTKRKRDEADEGNAHDLRAAKRPHVPDTDLHAQVVEAVRVITQALNNSSTQPLDPALISSIRLQLHQVFLFAVTSSACSGHSTHALQELAGLIQVIGVLSGIQIGQIPEPHTHYPGQDPNPWLSNSSPITTGIGTAVFSCPNPGCRKVFSRLYSLRAHQRGHAMHRPFRCTQCPASFVRNHDLKRHIKLHDRKAWKCVGCMKVFSRRDAIKRHKNGSKTRGQACLNADIVEVDLDEEEGEDPTREERRAKLWNGIASHQANIGAFGQPGYQGENVMEEGEVQPSVIATLQTSVMSLHTILQGRVGSALGAPLGQPAFTADPTSGQATLASVIARAQLQNLSIKDNTLPGRNQAPTASHITSDATHTTLVDSGGKDYPNSEDQSDSTALPSLSMYGLSDEQTKMLELAIASAASAAQAQAEAEAALEEEDDDEEDDEQDEDEVSDGHPDTTQPSTAEV